MAVDAPPREARKVVTALLCEFETDFVGERAASKLQLARVLAASGRSEEAAAEGREALTIYESKGDRPGAGAARALLDELSESTA